MSQNFQPIWFPHWPTCNVMISRGILASMWVPSQRDDGAKVGCQGLPMGCAMLLQLACSHNGQFTHPKYTTGVIGPCMA